MSVPRFDVRPFLEQDEGQHYERKSLFEGAEGHKRSRSRKSVRDQVATQVAAFANAEGGVLILGVEDDGRVTGHGLSEDALAAVLATPRARLVPPQPEGFVVTHGGAELLVFDVPQSDTAVQVVGDGFPLRVGDATVQASESQINALKFHGLAESWEARPSPLALADLDPDLLARARHGAGYGARDDEEYLVQRKLADRRGRGLVLRRGAELLFARRGPEHPNAGVRLFRVVGTQRRTGAAHNVEERPRIEGNLPTVLESTFAAVPQWLRRPARLRGTRFEPVPEYPDFCWIEAVLNAVAHRDYASEGRCTELWFFDDRLETVSPGALLPEITLVELMSGHRAHASRNPRVVRALVDLGYMRDQGEGLPRMFEEMAEHALPPPWIEASPSSFRVVLRNGPALGVSAAPPDPSGAGGTASDRGEPAADRGEPAADRGEPAAERGEPAAERGESAADRGELDGRVSALVATLGARPRRERLRAALVELCGPAFQTAQQLGQWVGMSPEKLVERHLSALVAMGRLELAYPHSPTHPAQAYRAAGGAGPTPAGSRPESTGAVPGNNTKEEE